MAITHVPPGGNPKQETAPTNTGKLLPDVTIEKIEKSLVMPGIDSGTSVLQAGYQMGVQAVLRALRYGV